ncbi:MAG TPA: hypothetical protein VKY65_14350 [Alphaproteobacteria bacterium]|nr:hypothetical protein [Alphaproteobacteria bacterium]
MKTRLFSLLAGVALLGLATAANAQSPVQLSDSQMDVVTAGATSTALGGAAAFGTLFSGNLVTLATAVNGPNAAALGDVVSIAASFSPGPGAAAASALTIVLTSP